MVLGGGGGDMVFTLRQDGNAITGSVESAAAAGIGGGPTGGVIEDGKVDGSSVTFRAGATTYSGSFNGSQIELRRSAPGGRGGRGAPAPTPTGTRPEIGPPPDGSDPSFGAGGPGGGGRGQQSAILTLRRAAR
jgi:beta-galactosidase